MLLANYLSLFSPTVFFEQAENVTVKARQVGGCTSIERNWESGYGSYDRTKFSFHKIQAEVSKVGAKPEPIELLFYYVVKSKETKKEGGILADKVTFKEGFGLCDFFTEAESNDAKYVYLQERFHSGDSVSGWFVRAVRNGVVVGYAASSERLGTFAQSGLDLKK